MPSFLDTLLSHPDLCLLLAMPVLAAFLGGVGNWLGWRVLFGSLLLQGTPWRRGLLGARAVPVARQMGETLASRISLSELFRLMEPERIAGHVSDSVMLRLDDYVDAIMAEKYAVLWDNLPAALRQRMYARVRKQLPSMLDNLVDDMAENIDALTDLPTLLGEQLGNHPERLVAVIEGALQAEKRFLLQTGVLVGLLLGGAELALFAWQPLPGWALPCIAVAVAILSFWLPRRLLLHPVQPVSFAGHAWQGLAYRQRPGFAALLSRRLVEEVLSLRSLMHMLLSGPGARRTRAMIKHHLRPLMEAGLVRTTIQLLLGMEGYAHIKQLVVERAVATTIGSLSEPGFNHDRTALIESACQEHLGDLAPAELYGLLHPLLAEEEWVQYLVVMTAGLGLGLFQWLWLVLCR